MDTLIVFSHLRWHFVYQRPQHLLTRLARTRRVIYVEEPMRAEGPARLEKTSVAEHIEVWRPHTPVEAPGFHDDQLPVLRRLLEAELRAAGGEAPTLWFYTPMALPLASGLRPRAIVYDCMDELSAFLGAPRQMQQREAALLKCADLVLTGGPSLYEARRGLHPNVQCLPSAVDARHYAPAFALSHADRVAQADALQQHIPRPRLGFVGVIDERLHTALLRSLAESRPDWQVVMVGPVVKIDPASLPQAPNIHWLGPQPYGLLPQIMAGWDVCLLPFALNEATRFISPTKTLEYLAADKPVVSTPVADVVSMYGDVVEVAADAAGFIDACERLLNEDEDRRTRRHADRLATVSRFSWDQAAETVEQALAALPGRRADQLGPFADDRPAGMTAATASTGTAPLQVRHIVVGAGPTGLSAAYHLGLDARGGDTLLIEREATVGGWCRSIQDAGFTFDYAGHIMFSNEPEVLALYDKLLGDNLHWQQREAWIYSKNVYTRYPFQGSLYGLPPAVLKECLIGAIEARFGPLSGEGAPAASQPPANFKEFIHRVWGDGIARHFATPYNEKLWAVPLEEMETSWLGGRVPLPDLAQMIEGALEPTPAPMGPNARFGYPLRGGFQALMDGFLPHLRGTEIALRTSVVHVSPRDRTVRLDDGRTVRFETLISTMPLPQLVAACGEEAPQAVREAAQALRHVSVRCVNLGVAREALTDKHWIYYPEDTVFHRIFVQGNASPHCNPPGGFGLTCEITYAPGKPLPCDGQALIDRVVADCRRVGMLRDDDKLITANQVDMPCAYVVYDHARAANVQCIRDWLASAGIVLAGRYSEWAYYNSDHAFVAGRRAADQALATLPPMLARAV
ncbi:FAD-dependent oxidoreductase [uncultured Aquabacterium sp.]|jgi:protoporphyrinogen oxidase/glycosyltransferase involved in cell wall biosynthesis|uniref:FAD-dependent oxidoreductase n=1 Tax=uncultured Aquabacterium sp. TaxID=158753 RepID=UPI0026333D46|nr:FAD-dependent oxidoreductase [uncultured Aquabacterium sp.]